jgi:hypothetical protein
MSGVTGQESPETHDRVVLGVAAGELRAAISGR